MAFTLLTEAGGRLLLEDNTGAILLEDAPTIYWGGQLAAERGKIYPYSYQVGGRENPVTPRW